MLTGSRYFRGYQVIRKRKRALFVLDAHVAITPPFLSSLGFCLFHQELIRKTPTPKAQLNSLWNLKARQNVSTALTRNIYIYISSLSFSCVYRSSNQLPFRVKVFPFQKLNPTKCIHQQTTPEMSTHTHYGKGEDKYCTR